ncbi:MAG: amino acid racemase [Chloroflexi bacterium]|nr:amino acid racemase [Chloroflexota bacterium]
MTQKLIGILAGMGPRSTAPFVDSVITQCQTQYGAKHDDDFPPMMIYSLPTPFYVDRPIDHNALKRAIIAGLLKLESTGVEFIAMPCNTAHIYFDELAASLRAPLLNMVDLALRAVPPSARKVALFATRPTANANVYQNGLERAGLRPVTNESWQVQMDTLIGGIKSSLALERLQQAWRGLLSEVEASGVDTILLACTDLNIVSKDIPTGLTLVDATERLAQATVEKWREP